MTVRPLASLLVLVAIHAASVTASQTPAPGGGGKDAAAERALQTALDDYAAGDDSAPARWARSLTDNAALRGVGPVLAQQPWSRSAAAFVLELIVATPNVGRFTTLLDAGRALLARRPSALGNNPEDDRFEVLWHQTAIGVLQPLPMVDMQAAYLDAIAPRFAEAKSRGASIETRFALTRAYVAAIVCCWERRAFELVRQIPRPMRGTATLESAVAAFDAAAVEPAIRVEALVRAAKLLYDAGRHRDALARFEQVPAHADPVIGYVQHLTRARVLDALDRPAEAADAYRAALAIAAAGQHAGIGLAAALLRAGQVDDAVAAADAARTMGVGTPGHEQAFNRGDGRFVSRWLAEIRTLRR